MAHGTYIGRDSEGFHIFLGHSQIGKSEPDQIAVVARAHSESQLAELAAFAERLVVSFPAILDIEVLRQSRQSVSLQPHPKGRKPRSNATR